MTRLINPTVITIMVKYGCSWHGNWIIVLVAEKMFLNWQKISIKNKI